MLFHRVSGAPLEALGVGARAIEHRLATRRLAIVEDDGLRGRAGPRRAVRAPDGSDADRARDPSLPVQRRRAYEWLTWERPWSRTCVAGTRRPAAAPERRRLPPPDLAGEVGELRRIPITSPERTLLDLASGSSEKALARALRESIRLRTTRLEEVAGFVTARASPPGRQRELVRIAARYAGLPLERARSGAETPCDARAARCARRDASSSTSRCAGDWRRRSRVATPPADRRDRLAALFHHGHRRGRSQGGHAGARRVASEVD